MVLLTALYTIVIGMQQGVPGLPVYVSMGMLLVELSLVCAWATLFSTFAAPMTATAYSLCIYLIGHFADDLYLFAERAEPGSFKTLLEVLYRVVPNLESFNLRSEAVHGITVPWSELGWSCAYGFGYTAAVLAVAMMVFEKRDFK